MANTSAACHEDASRSAEMCTRLPSSPSSAPGPSPTRRVTWLEPPVAASRPTSANPSPTASAPGDRDRAHREASCRQPHPEHRAARRDHDEAAAVRARLAPTDRDERQQGDGNEPAQAEGRPREQRDGDDDRGREVRRAVEAAALSGGRPDRGQRRPGRLDDEHDEVGGDERREGDGERAAMEERSAGDGE